MALFDYIEVFYNHRRRHSTLGQISPAKFEREGAAEGMDAAIPVDAKNAPTGIWKTAQNSVSHSAHPIILVYEEERRQTEHALVKSSTNSTMKWPAVSSSMLVSFSSWLSSSPRSTGYPNRLFAVVAA